MMDFSQLIIRHCDTIESQPGDELHFSKSMLLGKRLIMTGALEVFQCHHHGRMTGDDRETRKRHIFPISASALNCIIVQFDRRYQISMTGAEIEDEAMDVKYCEPGSN